MSEKIKPRPFECDREVAPTVEVIGNDHQVKCNWCGASGPYRPSHDEAVHGWNDRTEMFQ